MDASVKSMFIFPKAVVLEFIETGCTYRAAALAFSSLLSLVPLMVVSLSILSAFPVFDSSANFIKTLVFKTFVADSATVVQAEINAFVAQASQLPVPELSFLIFTALIMVFNMEIAFNEIWHVKKRRHGVSALLSYWAVLTLTPLLIGLAFSFGAYLLSLPSVVGFAKAWGLLKFGATIAPAVFTFLAFTLLYIALPNCQVLFRYAALGGVFATVLFAVAKRAIVLYFFYFPTYQLVYGALATFPILLVWLYILWLIVLLGAIVSYVASSSNKV